MKRHEIKFHTMAIENSDHEILKVTFRKALTRKEFISFYNRLLSDVNERIGDDWAIISHR